ncbi:copper resistance protein CopC [Sphingobium sp. PNB]|uniref:copper resistance protein CopC n=1 Tax=Sphingobium sp. PNB TaxID=863934 RepID=UPI001CA46ACB|nr:copper resistance protein CopC [Sphingobium sp. PNB]MCB4858687.1 copper resistance protein CopC [Sphingobium sp. PNB]
MKAIKIVATAFAATAMTTAMPVLAHPTLVASIPAAQASVASTRQVMLRFTERLLPQLTGLEITPAGMAGMPHADHMAHGAMPLVPTVKTTFSSDGKTLIATFANALPRGSYIVTWHAVAADTHRVESQFAFTVS